MFGRATRAENVSCGETRGSGRDGFGHTRIRAVRVQRLDGRLSGFTKVFALCKHTLRRVRSQPSLSPWCAKTSLGPLRADCALVDTPGLARPCSTRRGEEIPPLRSG